jgi:hypothetical protein
MRVFVFFIILSIFFPIPTGGSVESTTGQALHSFIVHAVSFVGAFSLFYLYAYLCSPIPLILLFITHLAFTYFLRPFNRVNLVIESTVWILPISIAIMNSYLIKPANQKSAMM